MTDAPGRAAIEALLEADPAEAEAVLAGLDAAALARLDGDWPGWRQPGQAPPPGDWRTWVMMAGRGFGKTRAGAEWVSECVRDPRATLGCAGPIRIALVAATPREARRVMIEGPSGLLAVARRGARPEWSPSLGTLDYAGGSVATVYSGANPDGLRGPEHHIAWCDELAKWARPRESWDILQMGLRLGERPRALVTTTPRPIAALRHVIGEADCVVTGGRMRDNPYLSPGFAAAMARAHDGTRQGRQELDGELIEDVEGSLWPRALIERSRVAAAAVPALRRVVIGVDPPATIGGDGCGIVAAGVDAAGIGYVLGDMSARGLSPEGWAKRVARAAEIYGADRVIAEVNQGGDMVTSVLRAAGIRLGVTTVHATRGKAQRAAPVAALFERGVAMFAGVFTALEDELAGLTIGGNYFGPGRSPDRADACVWALTALMLEPEAVSPRIRML